MFFVLLLYALFASVFIIAKTGLQYTQPLFLIGVRMFLAGILMLGYQYFFQRQDFKLEKKHLMKVIYLAAFNIYLTNIFEFWALQYLTSFKTCFIYSISPFVSALFSYFIFSENITKKKWLGLAIGFIGIIPILLNETTTEEQTGHLLFLSWAEISMLLAVVCSVYGWILLRQLVRDAGYTSFMANGLSMFMGGAMALTHSFFTEDWNPIPVTEYVPFLECAILLMIISNMICYNLYGALLKKFSATFMSFAGFSTPLFTALFGWFFLGEVITWPFYVSAAIVFLGLVIFSKAEEEATVQKAPQLESAN